MGQMSSPKLDVLVGKVVEGAGGEGGVPEYGLSVAEKLGYVCRGFFGGAMAGGDLGDRKRRRLCEVIGC